mgnify:CR=1 FL=1
MKILQETIIKDSNNLNNLNEIQNKKIKYQNKTENKINEEKENSNKNNTIETILQNINTSNIFKNISEISKKEVNFIERGVKSKIFETDNTPKNTENFSQNEINNENIKDKNMPTGRLEKYIFDIGKAKNIKDNTQKINEDLSSMLKKNFLKIFFS